MIPKSSKLSYDNRGSAIISALVVGAILTMLSLSLLAIAYSLYLSQKKNTDDTNEREMLYSAVEVIEAELLNASCIEYLEETPSFTINLSDKSQFGQEIVNNIWKGFTKVLDNPELLEQKDDCGEWLYYTPEPKPTSNDVSEPASTDIQTVKSAHYDLKKCSRFFELDSLGSCIIRVQLYWELPQDWDFKEPIKKDGTVLHAIYRLIHPLSNETMIKTERVYRLSSQVYIYQDQAQPTITPPPGQTFKYINFANGDGQFSVDQSFFPTKIEYLSSEPPAEPINVSNASYNETFYVSSDCADENVWDYSLNTLTEDSEENSTVYIKWDDNPPILVKYIVNGCSVGNGTYLYGIDNDLQNLSITSAPSITSELRTSCNLQKEKGNFVGWKIKMNGTYTDFFNSEGKVNVVLTEPVNYVYAVFESDFNGNDVTNNADINESNIVQYTNSSENINISNIYTDYFFSRIVG